MNSRFHRIILTALFACIAADAYAEGLDVRQFYPIAGSEGVFSVESSRTMKHLDYDIKLLGDYANTPLKYTDTWQNKDVALDHLVSLSLSGAIGVLDFLEVGVSVPFIPYEHYDQGFGGSYYGFYYKGNFIEIPRERGVMGDVQVRVKGTILDRDDYNGFGLGAGVILSIPTGNDKAYVGSPSFWARPYLIADYEIGPVEMMINAGFSLRDKGEFLNYTLEHGFNYGFGVNYHAVTDWLDVKGEIYGETPLSDKAGDDYQNSAEFLLGAMLKTPIGLNVTAGAGTGIGSAVRNPKYRVLFGVEYHPANKDTDGDGIYDRKDACTEIPGVIEFEGCPDPDEDQDAWCSPWLVSEELATKFHCSRTDECPSLAGIDEFMGCPKPDQDSDGWCDAWITDEETAVKYGCKLTDACPEIAGIDEFNGCPNPNTDGDSWCDPWITDQATADKYSCQIGDRCPELPGLDNFSGCPDADADGDGICASFVDELGLLDLFFCTGQDLCPDLPEDFDGFEDEDGCPEPDNDHDGICDAWVSETGVADKFADACHGVDKCPDQPETINGYKDDDGCPDEGKGKQLVFVLEDKLEIRDKIFFDNNKATIKKKSYSLLNQVAQTIQANQDIKHITVQGHTDDTGKYERNMILSRQRAQSVVDYLIKKGVDPSRLSSIGFGPDMPIDPAKTSKARALNRRVEFVIDERKSK